MSKQPKSKSRIIPSSEWLPIFENLEGFPNFPAYFRELASFFENDPRRDTDGFVRMQPLTEQEIEEQLEGFLAYFEDCPEDWEYVSAEELTKAFQICSLLNPSSAPYMELDADFSSQRTQASARATIRADAKRMKAERAVNGFKVEMYVLDAQHQRAKEAERSRLTSAVRRGNLHAALKLIES